MQLGAYGRVCHEFNIFMSLKQIDLMGSGFDYL